MSKRLVVCCDGTWNVADPADGSPTNIAKIALNVAPVDPAGVEQRVFYDQGVGTGRFDRLLGGAFGVGLSDNVRDAYRFLVENAEPDDDLYLFGFSRGAFTARSLGGLIRNCGVLRREHAGRVDEAYRLYRDRDPHVGFGGIGAELFRRSYAHEMGVRCIGVFDTVGALGVPTLAGRLGPVINKRWRFHSTELGPAVENAFQALAVDERRGPFVPSLWTGTGRRDQRVEQVWFRGAHSDVGGGYADPALADDCLRWMVARAAECGLAFRPQAFRPQASRPAPGPPGEDERRRGMRIAPDPVHGEIHDARKGVHRLARPHDRAFGDLYPHSGDHRDELVPAREERLAVGVVQRGRERPEEEVPPGFATELARSVYESEDGPDPVAARR